MEIEERILQIRRELKQDESSRERVIGASEELKKQLTTQFKVSSDSAINSLLTKYEKNISVLEKKLQSLLERIDVLQ